MVKGLRNEVKMYRSRAFNALTVFALFHYVIPLSGVFFSIEGKVGLVF